MIEIADAVMEIEFPSGTSEFAVIEHLKSCYGFSEEEYRNVLRIKKENVVYHAGFSRNNVLRLSASTEDFKFLEEIKTEILKKFGERVLRGG